jgi:hypothetical protein
MFVELPASVLVEIEVHVGEPRFVAPLIMYVPG